MTLGTGHDADFAPGWLATAWPDTVPRTVDPGRPGSASGPGIAPHDAQRPDAAIVPPHLGHDNTARPPCRLTTANCG